MRQSQCIFVGLYVLERSRKLKKILQEGGWVHIFPEGTRNRKPELGIQNNFTQGIAHLLLAANPIVLPFYHSGMEKILPVGALLPRVGKKVKIVFENLLEEFNCFNFK